EDDQVTLRLDQAAPAGVAVPQLGLVDHAGLGLVDLLDRAVLGVVVDHQDLVDEPSVVEALDHRADRVLLGVGHQHDRDAALTPHLSSPPSAGASGRGYATHRLWTDSRAIRPYPSRDVVETGAASGCWGLPWGRRAGRRWP